MPTFTADPAALLVPDYLEVVQSLQNLRRSVRLVANKRTFVRFHVHSMRGTVLSDASLVLERGAMTRTIDHAKRRILVQPAPDRQVLDHAFLFELEDPFRDGTVTVTARAGSRSLSRTVPFEAVPSLRLTLFGVDYREDARGPLISPAQTHFDHLASWLGRAYPVNELHVTQRSLRAKTGRWDCNEVNDALRHRRTLDQTFSLFPVHTHYYGLVDDNDGRNFMRGCAERGGYVGSGPAGRPREGSYAWDSDGSYADWYGGHEVGHQLGRLHAEFCNARDGADYPHPRGVISPRLVGEEAIFGFDASDNALYGPKWKDVMTYCDWVWLSDFTFHGIMDYVQARIAAPAPFRAFGATVDRLLVVGSIDLGAGNARLESILVLPGVAEIRPRLPGDYAIVLHDPLGVELARYPFTPERVHDGPPIVAGQADRNRLGFSELVPYEEGTSRVDLEGPGGTLGSVSAGASLPRVRVLSPNGGENLAADGMRVEWTANDPDGDESDEFFQIANRVPIVAIIEPAADVIVARGQTVALEGYAYDDQTGSMPADRIEWLSNLDGALGQGASLPISTLSLGVHAITLRADDGVGGVATDSVAVTVVPQPSDVPAPLAELVVQPSPLMIDSSTAGGSALLYIANRNLQESIPWVAETSEPWLTLAATSGSTPAEVSVSVDARTLAAGAHRAAVRVASPSGGGEPATVKVEVEVGNICAGDCDGDDAVTVDEILRGVNLVPGLGPVSLCPALDTNGDRQITIDEIVAAVTNGLLGCGSRSASP